MQENSKLQQQDDRVEHIFRWQSASSLKSWIENRVHRRKALYDRITRKKIYLHWGNLTGTPWPRSSRNCSYLRNHSFWIEANIKHMADTPCFIYFNRTNLITIFYEAYQVLFSVRYYECFELCIIFLYDITNVSNLVLFCGWYFEYFGSRKQMQISAPLCHLLLSS